MSRVFFHFLQADEISVPAFSTICLLLQFSAMTILLNDSNKQGMTYGHPLFIDITAKSDLHADVPSAPDNGAEIADSDTVADTEDGLLALDLAGQILAADRSGNKADAVDNVVALDEELLAGLDVL